MTQEELRAQVVELALSRQRMSNLKERWAAKKEAFYAKYDDVISALRMRESMLAAQEADTRSAALAYYRAHPDEGKVLLGGAVVIKDVQSVSYNAEEAMVYAKKHEVALALDKKAFEALIKAKVGAPGMITLTLTAMIASDLEGKLKETANGN